MNEKFTPGPWFFNEDKYKICDDNSVPVATVSLRFYDDNDDTTDHETERANAHLIAVAPKMYAKLSELEAGLRPTVPVLADDIAELLREARGGE